MSDNDILQFPARLLSSLPSPVRFEMHHAETNTVLHVFTCEVVAPGDHVAVAAEVVLDGIELDALVAGVEAGRVWPCDLRTWLAAKREDPNTRVVHEAVLGGMQPPSARPWTFGRVAEHLGLSLRAWSPVDTRDANAALAA